MTVDRDESVTDESADQDTTPQTAPPGVDAESEIPEDHPRYDDLVTRHRIEAGIEAGLTHLQGMHAEGRASAFDYLLGEETIPSADRAERAAAAQLLLADHPVLSVNGNVAALAPTAVVNLAEAVGADIEVNLFHRDEERLERIASHLREHGAETVKGLAGDATIPGLDHGRGVVDADGIAAADVVVVPLEDGDRAAALDAIGKTEIVIDLNPLSRSPQAAAIPIVDHLNRALPRITEHARDLATADRATLESIVADFDPEGHLEAAETRIRTGDDS